jgi:hypothetical protein
MTFREIGMMARKKIVLKTKNMKFAEAAVRYLFIVQLTLGLMGSSRILFRGSHIWESFEPDFLVLSGF